MGDQVSADTEQMSDFVVNAALLRGEILEQVERLRQLQSEVLAECFFIEGDTTGPGRVEEFLEGLTETERFASETRGDAIAADQQAALAAADATMEMTDGTYILSTGSGDDRVLIEETADGHLILEVNGNLIELTAEQSQSFQLNTGAGDDTISIGETVGGAPIVDGGDGTDVITGTTYSVATFPGGPSTDFRLIDPQSSPTAPPYRHNLEFDGLPPESPTAADKLHYAEWELINKGAKAATEIGAIDLEDATRAYDYFLYGNGADQTFALDEYLAEDPAGEVLHTQAVSDSQEVALNVATKPGTYRFVSEGTRGIPDYPKTENWQKAVGDFSYWTDTTVVVTENPDGSLHHEMQVTIRAEDKYDFNMGATDIASSVPDAANGRFQVVGLADSYIQTGEATVTTSWDGEPSSVPDSPEDSAGRDRDRGDSRSDRDSGERSSGLGRDQERNGMGDVARSLRDG